VNKLKKFLSILLISSSIFSPSARAKNEKTLSITEPSTAQKSANVIGTFVLSVFLALGYRKSRHNGNSANEGVGVPKIELDKTSGHKLGYDPVQNIPEYVPGPVRYDTPVTKYNPGLEDAKSCKKIEKLNLESTHTLEILNEKSIKLKKNISKIDNLAEYVKAQILTKDFDYLKTNIGQINKDLKEINFNSYAEIVDNKYKRDAKNIVIELFKIKTTDNISLSDILIFLKDFGEFSSKHLSYKTCFGIKNGEKDSGVALFTNYLTGPILRSPFVRLVERQSIMKSTISWCFQFFKDEYGKSKINESRSKLKFDENEIVFFVEISSDNDVS